MEMMIFRIQIFVMAICAVLGFGVAASSSSVDFAPAPAPTSDGMFCLFVFAL